MSVGMILVLQLYIFTLFEKIFMIGNLFKRTFQAIAEGAEMVDILQQPHEVSDYTEKELNLSG
jgi:ABC-type multidrug transport system fused ATPase/permease subunit